MNLAETVANKYLWGKAKEASRRLCSKYQDMPWWLGVSVEREPDTGIFFLKVRTSKCIAASGLPGIWEGFKVIEYPSMMPEAFDQELL